MLRFQLHSMNLMRVQLHSMNLIIDQLHSRISFGMYRGVWSRQCSVFQLRCVSPDRINQQTRGGSLNMTSLDRALSKELLRMTNPNHKTRLRICIYNTIYKLLITTHAYKFTYIYAHTMTLSSDMTSQRMRWRRIGPGPRLISAASSFRLL